MSAAMATYVLRAVLALVGVAVIVLGLDVALGGMATLGWQSGSTPFFAITDATRFAIRDNHIRFIGGVWLSVGLFMLAGSVMLERLRPVLVALTAMVFVGGLARLSALDWPILLSPAIAPSFLLELVLFPLLGLWVARVR